MRFKAVHSAEELSALVNEIGFLPFFANGIPGYSVEECTPRKYWFSGEAEGPWEWKGPVIAKSGCAYGKLFRGKAGFVSKRWFPDFANYRREGYDFDERCSKGLVARQDRLLFDILNDHDSLLSTELRYLGGYSRNGRAGFDTIVSRLQSQSYIVVADFEYRRDRYGRRYGWGVARYATSERRFGPSIIGKASAVRPERSLAKIIGHLSRALPDASEQDILALVR